MSSQCHSDVFEHQEKDNNAALFLERNFKTDNPDMWLTHDMVSRCVSPDGTTVLEKCDDGFAPMPDFDLYAAGFPCTPWSRSECLFKVDGHVCIEDPAVLSSLAMPGSWLIETWWMVGQARSTRRFWWWKQQAFLHLNPDHQAEKAQSVSLGMCQGPNVTFHLKFGFMDRHEFLRFPVWHMGTQRQMTVAMTLMQWTSTCRHTSQTTCSQSWPIGAPWISMFPCNAQGEETPGYMACSDLCSHWLIVWTVRFLNCCLRQKVCRFYVIGLQKPMPLNMLQLRDKLQQICDQISLTTAPFRDYLTFLGLRSEVNWGRLCLNLHGGMYY